jgi:hypothetical protein
MELEPAMLLLYAVLGSVVYAIGGYLKSGEKPDVVKFIVTGVIGLAIGVFLWLSNIEVTEQTVAMYVLALAGIIALFTTWVKGILARLNIVPVSGWKRW